MMDAPVSWDAPADPTPPKAKRLRRWLPDHVLDEEYTRRYPFLGRNHPDRVDAEPDTDEGATKHDLTWLPDDYPVR